MEHFSVVQSLLRAGLAGDRSAFGKQVQRLRNRLDKANDTKKVKTIDRLLQTASTVKEMNPSQVELSRSIIRGERLTAETHPPVDRETGAQLCTVDFDDRQICAPVLSKRADAAISALLEEWKNVTALKSVGIKPTQSLLIFGPPGSGKTVTAQYVASQIELPLVTARIDGLISSFLGKTARNIAQLFDFANRYSCILLLDEFDAIAKLRDDPQEIGEIKRVVNTLLQNLDHRQGYGITIAITNHDRLLDPAVWRRFETQLCIDLPDENALHALVRRFLSPLEASPEIVQIFAYCLKGYSGADIERICMSAKRSLALNGTSRDDPSMFRALTSVAAYLPAESGTPIDALASGQMAFIHRITNDPTFGMTQKALAHATGYYQSQITALKKKKPDPAMGESINAK